MTYGLNEGTEALFAAIQATDVNDDDRSDQKLAIAIGQNLKEAGFTIVRTSTIEDIRPHIAAWTGLLETYIASLPPDRFPSGHDGDDGSSDKGYAEHELRAMKRDLGALLAE